MQDWNGRKKRVRRENNETHNDRICANPGHCAGRVQLAPDCPDNGSHNAGPRHNSGRNHRSHDCHRYHYGGNHYSGNYYNNSNDYNGGDDHHYNRAGDYSCDNG